MNKKMKECFTPHAMMHSLTGFAIALILASFIPALANLWIGLVLLIIGIALDMMRKE